MLSNIETAPADATEATQLWTADSTQPPSDFFEAFRANHLFQEMQRILEQRDQDLVVTNHDHFYEIDRYLLQTGLTDNCSFLWLLHPNGTHLGRIGVLAPECTTMHSILNYYASMVHPPEMELYRIDAPAAQEARIHRIEVSSGQGHISEAFAASPYSFEPPMLSKYGQQFLHMQMATFTDGDAPYGHFTVHTVSGYRPTREEIVMATIHAGHLLAQELCPIIFPSSMTINGLSLSELYKAHSIEEPERGKFAPVRSVAETPAQTKENKRVPSPRRDKGDLRERN